MTASYLDNLWSKICNEDYENNDETTNGTDSTFIDQQENQADDKINVDEFLSNATITDSDIINSDIQRQLNVNQMQNQNGEQNKVDEFLSNATITDSDIINSDIQRQLNVNQMQNGEQNNAIDNFINSDNYNDDEAFFNFIGHNFNDSCKEYPNPNNEQTNSDQFIANSDGNCNSEFLNLNNDQGYNSMENNKQFATQNAVEMFPNQFNANVTNNIIPEVLYFNCQQRFVPSGHLFTSNNIPQPKMLIAAGKPKKSYYYKNIQISEFESCTFIVDQKPTISASFSSAVQNDQLPSDSPGRLWPWTNQPRSKRGRPRQTELAALNSYQEQSLNFLYQNPEKFGPPSSLLFWRFILFLLDHPVNRNINVGVLWENRGDRCFAVHDPRIFAAMWGRLQGRLSNVIVVERSLQHIVAENVVTKHPVDKKKYIFATECILWSDEVNCS